MLSSAANFGKRTLDALTPAVKTLAAAVTAIGVSIIPQNLGPAASPAPSLTPAFNSATAAPSPATKAPAAAPADVATVSTSLPKRTATPTPRTRSAKEHHTLTAAFQQPDPAVIDGQDMRFGKETYLNACAAGIQSWVCRHFAIN